LIANDSIASSFVAASAWKDHAEPRRDGWNVLSFLERLIAIVEKNVTDPILLLPFIAQVGRRDGKRKLVILRKDRPLLGEIKGPAVTTEIAHIESAEDVLDHTLFLVVGSPIFSSRMEESSPEINGCKIGRQLFARMAEIRLTLQCVQIAMASRASIHAK
jgi:hypothetical protein